MKKADEKERMCPECMGGMKKVRKDYVFKESGLSNVILKDIEVLECKKCGTVSPRIPRFNDLLRTIAIALVGKPGELTGEEVRFLRGYLQRPAQDFAKMLSISPSHLSRIENGSMKVGPQTDRLIRFTALMFGDGLLAKFSQVAQQFKEPVKKTKTKVKVQPETGKYEYVMARAA
jgi:YgiT-type zinc finger domain-containing protein